MINDECSNRYQPYFRVKGQAKLEWAGDGAAYLSVRISLCRRVDGMAASSLGCHHDRPAGADHIPGHRILLRAIARVHNEQVLREEVERVSKKADSAQRQKEQAQNERETIEEKIRNTRVALRSELLEIDAEKQMVDTRDPRNRPGLSTHARAVETAINILNS